MANTPDYQMRMDRVRESMQEKGISLLFLTPSANLQYLTGILRSAPNFGGVSYHGSWMAGLFLSLEGAILTLPRMVAEYDIRVTESPADFRMIGEDEEPATVLREIVKALKVHTGRIGLDREVWSEIAVHLQDILPGARWATAGEVLAPLREIKDATELDLMRKAGEVTDRVFGELLTRLRPGMTELEIGCELEYLMRREGAEGHSFTTAVFAWRPGLERARNDRISTRPLEPGCSVSFDFGCVLNGYCSDFGRSIFIGEPPQEYRRIYALVIEAQRQAMEAARGGQITGRELYQTAYQVVAEGGYGEWFGPRPRLGHGIGLDVHEAPWPNRDGQDIIKTDTVITIEPGIAAAGRYHARIEDVVHITPNGGVGLTNFPKTLQVIE